MSGCVSQSEADAVRAHIAHKVAMAELDKQVAGRMLAALEAGAAPDFAALHEAATFLPLPPRCFHTASVSARAGIRQHGLRAGSPGEGDRWGQNAAGQPCGVYVAADPDERGVWAHEDVWDVWEVATPAGTPFTHDRLNPGCWVVESVSPDRLRLHGTYSCTGTVPSPVEENT